MERKPRTITKEEFGRRLAIARTARGLTQEELGERIGRPKNSISEWERGLRMPYLDTVVLLADGLGLSLDDLVLGDLEVALRNNKKKPPAGQQQQPAPPTVEAAQKAIQQATHRLRELARLVVAGEGPDFERLLDALTELRVAERMIGGAEPDDTPEPNP